MTVTSLVFQPFVPFGAVADAVLCGGTNQSAVAHPVFALVRARALQAVVDGKQPWLEKAKLVAKRLSGISKEAVPHLHCHIIGGRKMSWPPG